MGIWGCKRTPGLGHQTAVYVTHRKNRDLSFMIKKSLYAGYGRNWHEFHQFYSAYYMWKLLRKDPDTVFIATTWGMAKPFKFLKKYFPKSKMIVVAHGLEITRLNSKKLSSIRSVVESSDLILSVSRFTRDEIINGLTILTLTM